MITLRGRRLIGKVDVLRDDVDPLTVYLVPPPRIALDDGGKPILSMVWYRRPLENLTEEERRTRLGGGILTLSTELQVTPAEDQEIRTALAADPDLHARLESEPVEGPDLRDWWANTIRRDRGELAKAIKPAPLPVKDGTVSIAILAETEGSTGEFVGSLIGAGRVSMTGTGRASFMAKLTQEGAVLLWEMLDKNLAAIRIGYDMVFNHRLNGVTMTVWADAQKTLNATQTQWASISDDASWSVKHNDNGTHYTFSHDESRRATDALVTIATASDASRVVVTPEAGPDVVTPEQIAELTRSGTDMVGDFLSKALLEFKSAEFARNPAPNLETALASQDGKEYGHHGIELYNVKSQFDSAHATLDVQVKTKAVMEGHLLPNDNLSNITAGHAIADFRTQIEIDPDWYQFLDVQVICTADFDNELVDLVRARLHYKATGERGAVDEAQDLVFSTADALPKSFTTYLAGPNDTEYDYEYEVFYKGGAETVRHSGTSNEGILVLDTDRLGVLIVDVQAGVIDWAQVPSVIVDLTYGSGPSAKVKQVTLTSGSLSATWKEVIGEPIVGKYEYQCTFVDKDGQRITLEPVKTSQKSIAIDQPVQDMLEVSVIPAGSFGPEGLISKVVGALRYSDPAHNFTAQETFVLTSDADTKTWIVPLADKTLRTYEYRVTVFYSDGVTREDEWITTDKPILPIGDPFGFRVQISPNLLKIANKYAFATIHLSFDDEAANISAEKDLQIDDFGVNQFWRFRLGSPDRHTYTYQLTLFTTDGQEVKLPEQEGSSEVLVLKPPAA